MGRTPLTVSGITLGEHEIELRKSGYQTWVKEIDVTEAALRTTWSYNPTLIGVTYAGIRITSKPADADIYIDGIHMGRTPLTVSGITLGEHEIELRKSGYQTWVKEIDVTEAALRTTWSYNPTLIGVTYAGIRITSKPADADI
ncbi:PEGA domain-containing protein, partial [Methanocalculus chunghsingensis]